MKRILEKKVLFYGVIVRTFWMTLVPQGQAWAQCFINIISSSAVFGYSQAFLKKRRGYCYRLRPSVRATDMDLRPF